MGRERESMMCVMGKLEREKVEVGSRGWVVAGEGKGKAGNTAAWREKYGVRGM